MRKQILHWVIIIALCLHIFGCIFTGQTYFPIT